MPEFGDKEDAAPAHRLEVRHLDSGAQHVQVRQVIDFGHPWDHLLTTSRGRADFQGQLRFPVPELRYLWPTANWDPVCYEAGEAAFRCRLDLIETVDAGGEDCAATGLAVFEELRLLLNYQLNDAFLVTLLLVGQPFLGEQVRDFPPLDQHVVTRGHLKTLSANEGSEYIEHRMSIAGRSEPVFTEGAIELIDQYSKGIPRKINNICLFL